MCPADCPDGGVKGRKKEIKSSFFLENQMDVRRNYFQIGSDLCESYLNVNSLVIPLYRVLGDKGE